MIKLNFITKYDGNCESFLIKPCNDNFIEEPFIVSLETPESHLEKKIKKRKKLMKRKKLNKK